MRLASRLGTSRCLLIIVLVLSAGLGTPAAGSAAELKAFEVTRNGARYRMHSDIALLADIESVRSVLSRYESIARIDPDISEVTMLGANDDGSVRMRLASSHCVGFVCLKYRWTQDVRTLPSGAILARMVPGAGDIESGWVRYQTIRYGSKTRLVVDAEIDASGIPLPASLIGPWMQRRLEKEAIETARLVERAAAPASAPRRARPPRWWRQPEMASRFELSGNARAS